MNEENLNDDYLDAQLETDHDTDDDLLEPVEVPPQEPLIKVQISGDKLSALLSVYVFEDGQRVSCEDICNALKENGIVYGIMEDRIRTYCETANYDAPLLAAEGLPAQRGRDGEIIHYFECDRELKPKERADGTIDFHDMDCVQNVDKDQVLSYKTAPSEGVEGFDVHGVKISAIAGKDLNFNIGENVYVSDDGSSVLAAIDGYVEIKNNRISVRNIFTVKEDVDASTGNIDVNGALVIKGDVREGFRVKAKGDIAIRGMVEGAVIESEGSISIGEGINGMNRGKIICRGDLHSRFIENAQVEWESDVHADAIINYNVSAGGSIILKSQRSCIRGGVYQAGLMIYAGDIGTSKNIPTVLAIGSSEVNDAVLGEQKNEQNELIRSKKRELRQTEKDLATAEKTLQQLFSAEDLPDKKTLIRTLLMKKNQMNDMLRKLKTEIDALEEVKQKEKHDLSDYKVVAIGTAYPGTKLFISAYNYELKQPYQYSKFQIQDGYIIPNVLNPGDKL